MRAMRERGAKAVYAQDTLETMMAGTARRVSCPQISEAYVVRRGTSSRDDVLKSYLRLPVLRSEEAQTMQNS